MSCVCVCTCGVESCQRHFSVTLGFRQIKFLFYCINKRLSCWTSDLSSTGWAEGWTSADFELLCADGRRAPLSEWASCNLGVIPPNTIMTRPVLTARVYDFLMKSQVSLCDQTPLIESFFAQTRSSVDMEACWRMFFRIK